MRQLGGRPRRKGESEAGAQGPAPQKAHRLSAGSFLPSSCSSGNSFQMRQDYKRLSDQGGSTPRCCPQHAESAQSVTG